MIIRKNINVIRDKMNYFLGKKIFKGYSAIIILGTLLLKDLHQLRIHSTNVSRMLIQQAGWSL